MYKLGIIAGPIIICQECVSWSQYTYFKSKPNMKRFQVKNANIAMLVHYLCLCDLFYDTLIMNIGPKKHNNDNFLNSHLSHQRLEFMQKIKKFQCVIFQKTWWWRNIGRQIGMRMKLYSKKLAGGSQTKMGKLDDNR